jgi:hypothetical protein
MVAKMIKIKSVNGTPDLEVWHLLKCMLNYLNVGGMSSEENETTPAIFVTSSK